jgi:hypothetical protein
MAQGSQATGPFETQRPQLWACAEVITQKQYQLDGRQQELVDMAERSQVAGQISQQRPGLQACVEVLMQD